MHGNLLEIEHMLNASTQKLFFKAPLVLPILILYIKDQVILFATHLYHILI